MSRLLDAILKESRSKSSWLIEFLMVFDSMHAPSPPFNETFGRLHVIGILRLGKVTPQMRIKSPAVCCI